MKKLLAILLLIALLLTAAGCAGGNTEPTERETTPHETGYHGSYSTRKGHGVSAG